GRLRGSDLLQRVEGERARSLRAPVARLADGGGLPGRPREVRAVLRHDPGGPPPAPPRGPRRHREPRAPRTPAGRVDGEAHPRAWRRARGRVPGPEGQAETGGDEVRRDDGRAADVDEVADDRGDGVIIRPVRYRVRL